jgi:NADPH-dependent glutamate synthase beta subunit-like oxidoreductase
MTFGSLEWAGTDVLFAPGNRCPDCPDRRCQEMTPNAIYRPNPNQRVQSVSDQHAAVTRRAHAGACWSERSE